MVCRPTTAAPEAQPPVGASAICVGTSRRAAAVACLLAAILGLALAAQTPSAWAHAQLFGSSPTPGATVETQPQTVIFEFNESVGGTVGAVRVYDAQGNEVDDLEVSHPDGNQRWMGVGLTPHLPEGTYTATYRVISADTHIVYGGLVFNLGHPSATSKVTVAGLIGRNESGRVTKIAFGVVRTLSYLALALMAGGMAFALLAWPANLLARRRGEERWARASQAFASRLVRLLACAVILGALLSLLEVLLQGASAAGLSLWSSLRATIVENTLESRFGWVWAVRGLVWLALGALLLLWHRLPGDFPLSRSLTSAGDAGTATMRGGEKRPGRPSPAAVAILAALALGTVYLLITPALAGHASVESPVGVFFPAVAIHVAAASIWVGGIACLLFVLPAATRSLEGGERSELLLASLARLSPLALGSVVAIAITGVIQAYIDVRSLDGLLHTTYGALLIAKTVLLLALIGLGWVNRGRVIPALRTIAAAALAPGGVGMLARRAIRGELALMVCVLGVTATLVSYTPPIDAQRGPFSANTTIGAAELEMTVEPARVGPNTIHLYLIDAKTGTQFTASKELTASAKLPAKGIGPLPLHASLAGPGHYVLDSAVLSPAGTWQIEIVDRVSEFEEHTRVLEVPIR